MPPATPELAVTVYDSFRTAWGGSAYSTPFLRGDRTIRAVGIRPFTSGRRADWGSMTASSAVIAIPAAAGFLIVQKHLVAGLTAGRTKG